MARPAKRGGAQTMEEDTIMKRLAVYFCFFSLFLMSASTAHSAAAPEVTRVVLGTAVNASHYAVVFDSDVGGATPNGNGIWINPGSTSGTSGSAVDSPAGSIVSPSAATMFGLASANVFATQLFSVTASKADNAEEMGAFQTNMPTNANSDIFGSAQGPANMDNIDLDRAGLAPGTTVTFTVNMNNAIPHLVSAMSGSVPV